MQKRFIAGAICPSCKSMDKIVLEKLPLSQTMECVNCGYNETQPFSHLTNDISEEQ